MTPQNFNPVFFLESLGSLAIVLYLVIRYRKRGLTLAVFSLAALSYFAAIAAKTVVQNFTLQPVVNAFGYASIETGLYLGAQTAVFEVLGAYLVAYYAHRYIQQKNASAYGISLAFWENGLLLGILPFISLLTDYLLIAMGPTSLASLVSAQLKTSSPGLFSTTAVALPMVGYSVLERISSLLVHYSWGFLVVSSVSLKKPLYLWIAFPMGFLDSIVPFAGLLGIPLTEGLFFAIGLLALYVAWRVNSIITKEQQKNKI